MSGAACRQRRKIIETATRRFVMYDGDMRNLRRRLQRLLHPGEIDGRQPGVLKASMGNSVTVRNVGHPFAIDAIFDDQHCPVGGNEAGQHRLDRCRTRTGQQNRRPLGRIERVDIQELPANLRLEHRKLGLAVA